MRYNSDIREFIKAALSPAVVSKIDLDRDNKRAKVIVAQNQLSLAIGKKGQNVRLASKLVGWELDIRSKESMAEQVGKLSKLKAIGKKIAENLVDAGFSTKEKLAQATVKELTAVKGIGKKKAEQIIKEAKQADENL